GSTATLGLPLVLPPPRPPRNKRSCPRLHLRLATLNVGSLTGRCMEIVDMLKRRNVDIACLQELRWAGSSTRTLSEGYKLYYVGSPNKRNGVGIIVAPYLACRISE